MAWHSHGAGERTHNLPAQPTPLIGRERDLAEVCARLLRPDVRLLTLTGTGGTGKTRLALAAAESLLDAFPHGTFFVDLAPLSDAALVISAIARTLGVSEAGQRPMLEALEDALQRRCLLLVLDNFEHLLPAGSAIADLLGACPHLRVLATSRQPLRLRWEHVVSLPPLEVPDLSDPADLDVLTRTPAVALFIQRAQRVNAGFRFDQANAAAVAEICVKLDGLPLAIELAAARSDLLPVQAILARLPHRFDLLANGARDQPERHHTLRAAIDWSYNLLSPSEQRLFRRLAVFAGGWTVEGAEAVCGATADHHSQAEGGFSPILGTLASLVEKGLVRADEFAGEPRFRLLETIREYALERLAGSGETDALRRQHAAYFLELAEEGEAGLRGRDGERWCARLEAEHDNLRAALRWVLDRRDAEVALRLAGALQWFWYLRTYWTEGRRWLAEALALSRLSGGSTLALAKAQCGAGLLAAVQGDYAAAEMHLDESVTLGRDLASRRLLGYALHHLSLPALFRGDHAAWRTRLEESVALFREEGDDRWGLAYALCSLGYTTVHLGDPAATSLLDESLNLFRDLGDTWGLARVLHVSGELARARGEYERAAAAYSESAALYERLGHRNTMASVFHNLGYVAQRQGNPRLSARHFAAGLRLHREYGDKRNLAMCLAGLAGAMGLQGQPGRAARLFGAAAARLDALGSHPDPIDRAEWERNLGGLRSKLGEATFESAWAAGWTTPLDQAIEEALRVTGPEPAAAASQTPTSAAQPWSVLTPREREVAQLAARGLSNRQIGERLVIAEGTARIHVERILGKLGLRSRAQLAAWAAEHGLLAPHGG